MNQNEKSQLEALANQSELVAPFEYNNPNEDDQNFFDFLTRYTHYLGSEIKEVELGFLESYLQNFRSIGSILCQREKQVGWTKEIWRFSRNIVFQPFYYSVGWRPHSIRVDGDQITVRLPKWGEVTPPDRNYRVHEYFHVYHALLAKDLEKRGLISIDGYRDIYDDPPYPKKAPSYEALKTYEKRLIFKMIEAEEKKPQTPIIN